VIVALRAGWLLLAPSTLAQHLREWLAATARPLGCQQGPDLTWPLAAGQRIL